MSEPGPLLARGRSADIFEIDGERVLRRSRTGDVHHREVRAMELARAEGFPVPTVHSVEGTDMVMERLVGGDLLSRLTTAPWRVGTVAVVLADLHVRLASVAPADLPVVLEPAEAVVHSDLHPGNVIDTERGPVVIDWEGAGAGPADADVATTWLLMTVGELDDVPRHIRLVARLLRWMLVRRFLALVGRPRPATIRAVCDRRLTDRNTRDGEREAIRRFRAAHGGDRITRTDRSGRASKRSGDGELGRRSRIRLARSGGAREDHGPSTE